MDIIIYQDTPAPTPTETPRPTSIWSTPTPRITITPVFDFIEPTQVTGMLYDFTDGMVVGYNSNREIMTTIEWFILASIVFIMFMNIYKRIKRL